MNITRELEQHPTFPTTPLYIKKCQTPLDRRGRIKDFNGNAVEGGAEYWLVFGLEIDKIYFPIGEEAAALRYYAKSIDETIIAYAEYNATRRHFTEQRDQAITDANSTPNARP